MERERRRIKPPQSYVMDKSLYHCTKKKKSRKKTLQKAQYQVIPTPMKFSCVANFYALYANIGLTTHQGTLHSDTRVVNQYCDIRGIEILKEQNFCKIILDVERKAGFQRPAWQNLVEGLLESESNELRDWGTRIKNFSLSYEETCRALSKNEININGFNEKELLRITKKTEMKLLKLLKEYPCFYYTTSMDSRIKEMCFNEQFIDEIGYSLESISTTILKEGVPRMTPLNTAYATKTLIENYFSLGKDGVETPEIISDLVMKNGYLKRVRYKVFYLPLYKDKIYNVSGAIILLGSQNFIASKEENEEICESSQNFLKKIIQKENQINKFMKKFYDKTLILPYTSARKVCKIRELDTVIKGEECLNKKEEY